MPRAMSEETEKQPNPVDIHVGKRVRMRRTLMGMSQTKLGDALGLTFQQVQKYENGSNRIGASRLYQISQILAVPVSYFFEEMDQLTAVANENAPATGEALPRGDLVAKRETLELVRAYYRIVSPRVRRGIVDMIRAIGNSEETKDA
ncbi:MAG: helix-turn-helix domain-containing protein [Minwuiales bacterium]|nr:helix-turn-helix domain-containing protein [Minwuiales bacterium]